MKRTVMYILLSVMIILIPLTTAVAAQEVREIRMSIEATGRIADEIQLQIARFNAMHEDINVTVHTISGGDAYNQALLGQIAAGVAPDVFLLDGGTRLRMFVRYRALLPLDDLVELAGIDIDNFEESLLGAFRVDGKLYGVPKDYNTTALFYHKELLEEKGIEPPTTWEELREAATALTTDERYGFGMNPQINYMLPFVESAGVRFVHEDGIDLLAFGSEEHEKALRFLVDMFVEDESAVAPPMIGAGWDGEMFANKQVAMLYGGSWIPGVIEEQETIGAVPLPVYEDAASMLYTAGWVIYGRSEHPEAAATLIEFLTCDEELVEGNKVGLIGLPPTRTAMEKLIIEMDDDPLLATYSEVVAYGTPFGWMDPRFVDQYNRMMEVLIYRPGTKTERQAIDDLVLELQ